MQTPFYNMTILYAEDDIIAQESVAKSLRVFFKEVLVASNGLEALETFKKHHDSFSNPIDLLITDINMPFLNGFEVIEKLRFLNPELHSIITSGNDFGPHLENINKVSILTQYIAKPINMQDLYNTCVQMIEKIKERKEYKKHYNLSQQYKNAIENSAIVSKTDPRGKITYVNDAFCQISGYTQKELIGKSHNIIRHPDVASETFAKMWKMITAKLIWKYESLPNKAKDGSTYYVNTTIIPILNERSEITEFISIRFDTTSLEKSILDERKAKESQTIFLANMSHEIRTPLNGMIGFVDLLKDFESLQKETIKEYIGLVDQSSHDLLNTINEILDISKIQTGKMEIESVWFDLSLQMKNIFDLYSVKAKEKHINFHFKNNFENLQLFADATKLKHIISNLLSNAIKFTANNGNITFSIKIINQTNENITLEFNVIDDGIGIAKEKQKDIFNPFIQENQSTTREYGGTGLGLSIVKEMVALMRGSLKLESQKNQGSCFSFTLQSLYKFDALNEEKRENKTSSVTFNGNILVAEDVLINQKLIHAILAKHNIQTTMVNNGLEAVNMIENDSTLFDMILLDINMPLMDGMEACKKIKQIFQESSIDTAVVALTANAIKGDKEKFLSIGFDDYLSKPINNDALEKVLEKYLPKNTLNSTKKLDLEQYSQKLGLPKEFYTELLKDYYTLMDKELPKFQEFINNNEISNIKEQAHKLKGVSANLGLDAIATIFNQLENSHLKKEEHDQKFKSILDLLDEFKANLE